MSHESISHREIPLLPDLEDKFKVVYGIVVDRHAGVANVSAIANLLYHSLYAPEAVVYFHDIEPSETFLDRIPALESNVPGLNLQDIPSLDEFTTALTDEITRNIDYKSHLYDGAEGALKHIASSGPTVIWTQGDMAGVPEQGTPGSYASIKKIAGSGIGTIRREVALAKIATGQSASAAYDATLRVEASEDKFADDVVERMADWLKKLGATNVVVLDDRIGNLERIIDKMLTLGFSASGIWVRQGSHSKSDTNYDRNTIQEVASIRDVSPIIDSPPESTGFIVDFDDVLSNHSEVVQAQIKATQDLMVRKGWLRVTR